MNSIEESIRQTIKEFVAVEVKANVETAANLFKDLRDTATTSEVAKVLRTTEDTLRKTAADSGIPHNHIGTEFRYFKPALIEWAMTGKRYECEICKAKIPERRDKVMRLAPRRDSSNDLPPETMRKLVSAVRGKV